MMNPMNKPALPSYFHNSRAHCLDNKNVQWNELVRVQVGRSVDFNRVSYKGTVRLVSPCGMIAIVQKDGVMVEVEVSELDVISCS